MLAALAAAARAAGDTVNETHRYQGGSDWLILFGVGAKEHDAARRAQLAAGGRALVWDLGYIDREKKGGHLRMSIDTDHPPQWLEKTPSDPSRLEKLSAKLREDADPSGPILLIGLGHKSRAYLKLKNWEQRAFESVQRRFPGRRVIFRPKGADELRLACDVDPTSSISDLLRGASLVVCRHSNVAIDAAIAGVPFEAEDGAAMWLHGREFTRENRLEFLKRLAYWQWKPAEAAQAWAFAKEIACA
ncbi:hypothetical protein A8M77_30975 [Variovorax sp. JS1663]|nr:hypothetical protein A8M77_30975 [Variovorax sp. JS1663]